jgi:uncharacterized membrane protein YcaP (DUF421 family)
MILLGEKNLFIYAKFIKGGFILWNNIFNTYWHDFKAHTKEEILIQILSIVFILIIGVVAIKIIGKKSISQMTLVNVLFVFVLSSTLGALITKPHRIIIALIVVATIVTFVLILEKLSVKTNALERIFVSFPSVIYQDNQYQINELSKNNLTVDQIESSIRAKGISSVEACKTIVLEPTGGIAVEVKPEYEPIKKIYFDKAVEQILKAINEKQAYQEAVPDIKKNLFEEASKGFNQGNVNSKLD